MYIKAIQGRSRGGAGGGQKRQADAGEKQVGETYEQPGLY